MKFGPVPLDEIPSKVLAHNILGPDSRKALSKGHVLKLQDVELLRTLGYKTVVVAALEPGDLNENEAAERVGRALAGPGIRSVAPGVGRANLMAEAHGVFHVNVDLLNRLNSVDEGITIATLPGNTVVTPGQLITLVKIIPFGVSAARVADVEMLAHSHPPVLSISAFRPSSIALIISGPEHARDKLLGEFVPPVRARVEALQGQLTTICFVPHTAPAISQAISELISHDLIILAGVSAIIDRADVVPEALIAAGGAISQFGVPVDPGSLLMLGYIGDTPVVGAPGCVKSPKTNVIDWILPRLLTGERLTRTDLVILGHGGLLDDIEERPMPRQPQSRE